MEAAFSTGMVRDATTLEAFLRGRLRTYGTEEAHSASAVCDRASRA